MVRVVGSYDAQQVIIQFLAIIQQQFPISRYALLLGGMGNRLS